MKLLKLAVVFIFAATLALIFTTPKPVEGQGATEAPAHDMNRLTDDLFNGFGQKGTPIDECAADPVPNRSFEDNRFIFDEIETPDDGLGPTYNAEGCGSCHQNPETGGSSQIRELRAGHLSGSNFVNPPGNQNQSLIQLRAVAAAIQERLDNAPNENITAFRTSLSIFGDGFIESLPDSAFTNTRNGQPAGFQGTIISVPVVEANNALRIGRFGWKAQHASLLSFAGDAYLNEMGITNPFDGSRGLVENNSLGDSVAAFDRVAEPEDDGDDVEAFATFMRQTRVPARGPITAAVTRGQQLFILGACDKCHTPTLTTAPAGTSFNGGQFIVPAALGNKIIHPYSDLMLHDIGTGDGIVQNGGQGTRNMVRTPPLWGVRGRPEMMHDGLSFTFAQAIQRHAGTGGTFSRNFFNQLDSGQKSDLIEFLLSL